MSEHLMTIAIERDGDVLTAQCDPYDICTQGRDLPQLFERLNWLIGVEAAQAGGLENVPRLPTADNVGGLAFSSAT